MTGRNRLEGALATLPYRVASNPDYWQSVMLGVQHGIWETPWAILTSIARGLGIFICAALALVIGPIFVTLNQIFILVAGLTGFLKPQEPRR